MRRIHPRPDPLPAALQQRRRPMFVDGGRDAVLRAQEGDRIHEYAVAEGELLRHGCGKGFPPGGIAVSD